MDLTAVGSAGEVAAAVASGEVRSRAVVELVLERISRSTTNAVITVDADAARLAADVCDQQVRDGRPLGRLHGVPMTVKDAWQVRGMRSTSGLSEYAVDMPDEDAVAVARLRRAGAVIVGRTNVPPGITGQETANSLFGRTVNPIDHSRTPGGSSGGAAAAVAEGLTWLELGSDSGGSIRQPAHCCGVFGHAATHGLVPLRGHRPQAPMEAVGLHLDLMTAGPLAASAPDLGLALDVLVGDDPALGPGRRLELPPPRTGIKGARLLVWLSDEFCPTDSGVLGRLRHAATAAADAGASVETARPRFALAEAWEIAFSLWVASSAARNSDEEMARFRDERSLPGSRGLRARAETMDHRDWLRLSKRRHEVQRAWLDLLSGADAILLPVMPVTAPPHTRLDDIDEVASVDRRLDQTIVVNGGPRPYLDQLTWNIATGLGGLPTTVAPVGSADDGLPVGVAVVSKPYCDRTTIAIAGDLAALCA